MAKTDIRSHDLLSVSAPAWFAMAAAPAAGEHEAWDWLAHDGATSVEVTEFPVTSAFIEALFGVAA